MRPDVLPASLSRQENGLWVPEPFLSFDDIGFAPSSKVALNASS